MEKTNIRKNSIPVDITYGCQGFALIELMGVIAIVGILAATALPMYANHISRAQLTRVFSELSSYRQSVEIHIASNTMSAASLNPATLLGFVDSNLSSVSFGNFSDGSTSHITANLDGNSNSNIHNTKVILSRSLDGIWTCTINGSGSGWNDGLKPVACQ